MDGLTPEASARLQAYYPLFRRWVAARQRLFPHLAGEIEDAAWLGFLAACRKWEPARCPVFATYLRKYLHWRRPYRLTPGREPPTPERLVIDVAGPAGPDPAEAIDLAERLARLPAAYRQLAAADRELLTWLYRDGLTVRVVAAMRRCYPATVARHRDRALDELCFWLTLPEGTLPRGPPPPPDRPHPAHRVRDGPGPRGGKVRKIVGTRTAGRFMTRAEQAAIRQTIAEAARPSLPGARQPDPLNPDHWLNQLLPPDEIARLMASKDFATGWKAVDEFYAARLRWIMSASQADLKKFTGTK